MWRRASEALIALVGLTILAGGFVAGLHAGLTYNTFPLMDGSLVPAGYAQLQPFVRNWFENIAAVQFDHRLLAMTSFAAVLLLWLTGRHASLPRPACLALHALLAAAALQFTLGVATLLLVVPIPLAAAHQAGAVLLLTAVIVLRHQLRAGLRKLRCLPVGSLETFGRPAAVFTGDERFTSITCEHPARPPNWTTARCSAEWKPAYKPPGYVMTRRRLAILSGS